MKGELCVQWVILTALIAAVVIVGCFWFAIRLASKALQLQEKAVEACREAVLAQERTAKMAMDRILALKDYAAYGMVKESESPPRKHRPVQTIRM